MMTLYQKLCESLLDDEGDLVNSDEQLKNELYKKIFGNSPVQRNQIYIDDNLNVFILDFLSSYMNQAYDNLFSGEIVNYIKGINRLDLSRSDERFLKINKKPITIDKIHDFHVVDEFTNVPKSKNLKINEVDNCDVVVLRHEWNWIKFIKKFKINNTLNIYCHWDHKVGDPQQIHKLEGVDVPVLSIGVESFKDWINTPHTKKFDIKSSDNMDVLDHIYEKNKFDELYINNNSDYAGTRYVVEKVNTKRRYKFKQIRW